MKYFLLILGLVLSVLGVSALFNQTSYLNLPFSLDGAQIEVGIWLFVGAALFFVLSTEVKKKVT